jgi:predicted RNase H-like HicB family nuclease
MNEINQITSKIENGIDARKKFVAEMPELPNTSGVTELKKLQEAIDFLMEFKIRLIEERRINESKKKDTGRKIPFMRPVDD